MDDQEPKKFSFKFKKITIEERIMWFEKQVETLKNTETQIIQLKKELDDQREYIRELENTISYMKMQDESYSKKVNSLLEVMQSICTQNCGIIKLK